MERIMSNNKIYVGNLSYNTDDNSLREEFSDCGDIEELNLITDRETGRSKGFAFITFATEDAVTAAIEKNGKDVDGRNIRVNKAEERAPRTNNRF
jgi:RNA recognition motif-containing protein